MRRNVVCCMTALAFVILITSSAHAVSQYLDGASASITQRYGAAYSCDVCHLGGPPALNSYGSAFSALPHGSVAQRDAALSALEPQDSDGDGFTNIEEFQAGTLPGDPLSKPAPPPDATPPTVSSFTVPATSASLTVSFTIVATDTVGVTGHLVTEASTPPAAAAVTGPGSGTFTFATAGAKTLFAWARDAAGNVSSPGFAATVTVALPPGADAAPPVVTAFSIPATSSSLTVPVQALAATDDVGVTGFMVTNSNVAPAAADTRWNPTQPQTFVASAQGALTLFAWAKDAAGNVSQSLSATVTITLPSTGDTVAPTVPGGLAASATSGAVSLTWAASVDNVGVTGYIIFRNGTQIATTQTSTNFVDAAVLPETTYSYTVRATDASGNISANSNSVTVTTPAAGGNTIPLPSGGQLFPFLPVAAPVLSLDPNQVLPIGLGAYANEGDTVALVIGLAAFNGPVDVYLGLSAPTLSPEPFILNSTGVFQPLSAGLVPWKRNMQPELLSSTLLPELPMSSVPPGRYTVSLAVTPTGTTTSFYWWETAFTVAVPWFTSLSGAQAVPPVATAGTGVASFGVDQVSGALSGTLDFSGLSSPATLAHIHQGAAGTNGPVVINLTGGDGATSGVWSVPPGVAMNPSLLAALQSGDLYFMVHSQTHPTGEIRGQITYPEVRISETLSGAEMVPPVTTIATATASLTVNVDTGEISGTMSFANLSGNATGGHIHLGSPTNPGPIVVDFEGGDGTTTGTFRVPVGATMTNEQLAALASNNTYLVIHSLTHESGELAGQIAYPAGAPAP